MNRSASKPRLLLVDDDALVLRAVSRLLRGRGYDVESAASVASALERLSGAAFDVVITDLSLADGSGLDVLDATRAGAVVMADPCHTLPSHVRSVSKDQPASDLVDAVNAAYDRARAVA